MVEWLPIESAPKDGTPVIILAEGSAIEAAYQQLGEWDVVTLSPHGCGCCSRALAPPTHWMPLPPPPVNP